MKQLLLLIGVVLSVCAYSQQTTDTLNIDGTDRIFVKYLPSGFDPVNESLPVVICLHGIGDLATNIANIGFNQMGDTARFISVYPQGLNNGFGQSSWANNTLLASNADDIQFFHKLIDDMVLNHNADPARIYVTGFSMGGIMSYTLACELNNRVAAVASMSGTMSTQDLSSCVPAYKTPVIHFHGTADGTVPYDSSPLPSLSLVPETIEFWRNEHTCAMTYDSTQIFDAAADGYTVDRFVFQTCTPTESLELWRINGGDHEYFYQPINDFTEAIEIWLFFQQWSHSNPASAGINSTEVASISIAPNPTEGKIEVSLNKSARLNVYSSMGTMLHTQKVTDGTNIVDLSGFDAGVYFIKVDNLTKRVVIN